MKAFEYLLPRTLEEAVALKKQHGTSAVVMAGSTDIVVRMRDNLMQPDYVIDLKGVPGLGGVTFSENDGLHIGALATMNENDSFISWLLPEDMSERDANAAREAFDIYKELVLRFPQSRFAPDARRRMHRLVLAQAQHELRTAQYYYERHAYVAAIERAQRVVREFQNTPMRDDALELIRTCYEELKMDDLAKDTQRLIDINKGREKTVR